MRLDLGRRQEPPDDYSGIYRVHGSAGSVVVGWQCARCDRGSMWLPFGARVAWLGHRVGARHRRAPRPEVRDPHVPPGSRPPPMRNHANPPAPPAPVKGQVAPPNAPEPPTTRNDSPEPPPLDSDFRNAEALS